MRMDEMMLTPQGKTEINNLMSSDQASSYAGCTATVCLVTRDEIYCANAGDSRSVLSNKGIAIELS